MRIIHNIGGLWRGDQVEMLARFGISVTEDVFSYVSVEPEQFALIKDIVMLHHPVYKVGAEFDKADMAAAEWLALTGLKTYGYPQPQNTFDFLDVVYDPSRSCDTCGIVLGKQQSPFRIKSDKTKLLAFQLVWVYDEIFVERGLYDDVFLPLGIGCWPVLIHRTGEASETIVQLDLSECEWDFDMAGMEFESCSKCGHKKYRVIPMDLLPPLNGQPPNQIFRGREQFGSGGQADQRIYLSQDLRLELIKREIARWYQFYPLRPQQR